VYCCSCIVCIVVHPRTGHESPKLEYNFTLSLTSVLDEVVSQRHAAAAIYRRENPGTHCTGGWVGPRAGLNLRKISSPPGFDPRTVQPGSSVAIPTELPGPHCTQIWKNQTRNCQYSRGVSKVEVKSNSCVHI